jgi:hypothetical protein
MSPPEILRYVRATPFRPFRIHMASGQTFDIRHPEMVRVGTRDIIIFKLVSDTPDVYDDWDTVGLLLIESISHLEPSVA